MYKVEMLRYLKHRVDKRPVYLKNFVDQSSHHGQRKSEPSVTIVIPTRDKVDLLQSCVESIFEKTTYSNYSIIVVDNQSTEETTLNYLEELKGLGVAILKYPHKFNYSAICNFAASTTNSEFICFLNNDTLIGESSWLSGMVAHGEKPDIGLVGAKLFYPNSQIQHVGVAVGLDGLASHPFEGSNVSASAYLPLRHHCYQVSGVTFACALIRRELFIRLDGLDETFPVGFNDIDFALRCSEMGFKAIVCDHAKLTHVTSATRGREFEFQNLGQVAIDNLRLLRKHLLRLVLGDSYFHR